MNENNVVDTSKTIKDEEVNIEIKVELKLNLPPCANAFSIVKSTTNGLNGHEIAETIHRVYDEIVQQRKDFFKLPSRNAAKMFI